MPQRRAALYLRVSTRHQVEHNGTDAQLQALQRLADQRGWVVAQVFRDEGVSGRKRSRPGLDRMMAAVRRGEIDVVAVWRFDRFARSLVHLVQALDELRQLNVDFVSHQEALDTGTPMGRVMFQMAGAFAEFEADLARERIQAGMDAARARGAQFGRPRKQVSPEEARAALAETGSVSKAAEQLGVSRALVRRRLGSSPALTARG